MDYPSLLVQMLLSVASVIVFVYALAELSLATQRKYTKEHPSFAWFLIGAIIFILSKIINLISFVLESKFWDFLSKTVELIAFLFLIFAFRIHIEKHKKDVRLRK